MVAFSQLEICGAAMFSPIFNSSKCKFSTCGKAEYNVLYFTLVKSTLNRAGRRIEVGTVRILLCRVHLFSYKLQDLDCSLAVCCYHNIGSLQSNTSLYIFTKGIAGLVFYISLCHSVLTMGHKSNQGILFSAPIKAVTYQY